MCGINCSCAVSHETAPSIFRNVAEKLLWIRIFETQNGDTARALRVWRILHHIPLWFDPDLPRHLLCRCRANLRERKCLNPSCRCKFRPKCNAELFCCLACFLAADFLRLASLIVQYEGNLKKVRDYTRKVEFRQTEEGRLSRQPEYKKRNARRNSGQEKPSAAPSIREHIFEYRTVDSATRICACVGCHETIPANESQELEQRYCSESCRETMRIVRKRFSKTEPCPLAAFVKLILQLMK